MVSACAGSSGADGASSSGWGLALPPSALADHIPGSRAVQDRVIQAGIEPQDTPNTLEGLPTEPLYSILVFLEKQDVAHVKMCSRRLRANILRACQHWAPKVESRLASDPSSAGLLQQLRGAGGRQLQPPTEAGTASSPALSIDLPFEDEDSSSLSGPLTKQQQAAAGDEGGLQGGIGTVHRPPAEQLAAAAVQQSLTAADVSSHPLRSLVDTTTEEDAER